MFLMKTIEEIRRENLLKLIEEKGSIQAVADAIQKSHSQVSQWKNASLDSKTKKPRTLDSESARLIELKCGKDVGWMDNLHEPVEAPEKVQRKQERTNDSFWDTITFCYPGLSSEHKDAVAYLVNKLYSIDNPENGIHNPYSGPDRRNAGIKGKEKAKEK